MHTIAAPYRAVVRDASGHKKAAPGDPVPGAA
jgi:hypothetical protein